MLLKILIGLFIGLLVLLAFNYKKLNRLYEVIHFFDPDRIEQNFQQIENVVEVSQLNPSSQPLILPKKLSYVLPDSFEFFNKGFETQDLLDDTHTEGLIIIHNDTIVYENYQRNLSPEETHISWSMSKSFVSTLAGILIDKGQLDISKTVDDYLPQFKGTGYEGVVVEDVMQMSSGVRFNEDYGDFNSDINRFGRTFALGSSFEDFAKSLENEKTPGTVCHYVSIDTQVLGMIIVKISGMSLTDMCQQYLWEPMGMEYDGAWVIDGDDMEMALGGLNATLRDYAKFGLLYLHNGSLNGNQILSQEYCQNATTALEAHLLPEASNAIFGYGYQWWIPWNVDEDFFAAGIYHQYIYINKKKNVVIAKLSADPDYNKDAALLKRRQIALFQHISNTLG